MERPGGCNSFARRLPEVALSERAYYIALRRHYFRRCKEDFMGSNPKPPFDLAEFLSKPASPETLRIIANRRRRQAAQDEKPEQPEKSTKLTE